MVKLICHQKGNLFIKCKNCSYSWNTAVVAGQEVDDTCPNCGTHTQRDAIITRRAVITHHAAITVEGTKPTDSVDIPEFMSKSVETVTMPRTQLDYIIADNYELGKQKGLSIGISIGLVIMGIVLFFLSAPFSTLPI